MPSTNTELAPDGSIYERSQLFLDKGMYTDITFIVGNEKKAIPACKFPLALASPVFEKMFYGEVPETGPVIIIDIEPRAFRSLLMFCYSHKFECSSANEALEIVAAAHKYLISELVYTCKYFLMECVSSHDVETLGKILDAALLYDLKDLKQEALKVIKQDTSAILESPAFLKFNRNILEVIVQMDQLAIKSEKELLDALIEWAKIQCEDDKMPRDGAYVRNILDHAGIFKYIRFLTLPYSEMEILCNESCIITSLELSSLLNFHCDGDGSLFADRFSLLRQPRNIFFHSGRAVRVRVDQNLCVNASVPNVKEEMFTITRLVGPFNIVSVTVKTQKEDMSSKNKVYEENIKVELGRLSVQEPSPYGKNNSATGLGRTHPERSVLNSEYALLGRGHFIGKVKYNSELTIALFEIPVAVREWKITDCLKVKVHFYKPGKYDIHSTCNKNQLFKCIETEGIVTQLNIRYC